MVLTPRTPVFVTRSGTQTGLLVPPLRYRAGMTVHIAPASQTRRIVAGLPFVESLARRMAATMPNSIDIGDLVQDGVLGLIDAAHRFDEARGRKFWHFPRRPGPGR